MNWKIYYQYDSEIEVVKNVSANNKKKEKEVNDYNMVKRKRTKPTNEYKKKNQHRNVICFFFCWNRRGALFEKHIYDLPSLLLCSISITYIFRITIHRFWFALLLSAIWLVIHLFFYICYIYIIFFLSTLAWVRYIFRYLKITLHLS